MEELLSQLDKKEKREKFGEIFIIVFLLLIVTFAVSSFFMILKKGKEKNNEINSIEKDLNTIKEMKNTIYEIFEEEEYAFEIYEYALKDNFTTYTDSSGTFGSMIKSGERWKPDGNGWTTTITFTAMDGIIYVDEAVVNDMSWLDSKNYRKEKSCRLVETSFYERIEYIYNKRMTLESETYKNSQFTIFVGFSETETGVSLKAWYFFSGKEL